MRFLIGMVAIALLSACTPGEVSYCESLGVISGSPEFGKCTAYYFQQEAAFQGDTQFCSAQADLTYPQSLYSEGQTVYESGHFDGRHWIDGENVYVPPDYRHNRELNQLRSRIVTPCMQSRGWNSPENWQAGRHAVTAQGAAPAPVQGGALPWLPR